MANELGQNLLRPVASPVDTFVQPGPSPLQDLAESLTPISRELRVFLSDRAAEQDKQDELRGEAALYNDEDGELAGAIKSGKIPAQYSKAFVRGYKNAQGLVAGQGLKERYADAYRNWEGKDSEDPEAYGNFLKDFLAGEIGTDDPEVLQGLLPTVRELQQNGRSQWLADKSERLIQQSIDTHSAGAMGTVQDYVDQGLADPKGTDYEAMWKKVMEWRDSYAKTEDPAKIDAALMEGMAAKIVETGDPELLKFFDLKVPGQDYTYGDTPYGIKLKNATLSNLQSDVNQREEREAKLQEKRDKEALEEAQRQAVAALGNGEEVPEEVLKAGEKHDPLFRTKLAEWRNDLTRGFSDQGRLMALDMEIIRGGGVQAVLKAAQQGVFGTQEDFRKALSLAQTYRANEGKINEAQSSSIYKNTMSEIRRRTITIGDDMNPVEGISQEGSEAQYDFERMAMDWITNNPNADLATTNEAMAKISKQVLDNITGFNEIEATSGEYKRPDDLGFENPYTEGIAPPQGETGDAEQEATSEEQPAAQEQQQAAPLVPEDPQAFIASLEPDQRSAIEQQAADLGITPEDYVAQSLASKAPVYDPSADVDLGEGDDTGAPVTMEMATAFIDQALSDSTIESGAQDSTLLGLIRQHEAAGNYNAVYGNAGSKRNLSVYTVDQILAMQQSARRRGAPSTAIGAYQFIFKTLRSLRRDMGLTGKEKFTPELQDRMAIELLRRRGLEDYRAGRISKVQFAKRLSQEWASLPNPSTGRSFYAGDGLNASSVSTRKMLQVLGMDHFIMSYDTEGEVEDLVQSQETASIPLPDLMPSEEQKKRFRDGMAIETGPRNKSYAEREGGKKGIDIEGFGKDEFKDSMGVQTGATNAPYSEREAGKEGGIKVTGEDIAKGVQTDTPPSNSIGSRENFREGMAVETGAKNAPMSEREAYKKPVSIKEFLLGDAADPDFDAKEHFGIEVKGDPYKNIPDMDDQGNSGQKLKFREWNSDPIGNHHKNLAQVDPSLQQVIKRAQQISGIPFVVASGVRDDEQQGKAVEWGWSKTRKSDHNHGEAADLWGLDKDGAVDFGRSAQQAIVIAMKRASRELGIPIEAGYDWTNRDAPHFAIKSKNS